MKLTLLAFNIQILSFHGKILDKAFVRIIKTNLGNRRIGKVSNVIDWKLRAILRKVKSKNPQKRYEALNQLFSYKRDENIQVQVDVLKDMIKTAASMFPDPVDDWDNPSFYLIDFVSDFPMQEVSDGLVKHFDTLDLRAKERAIQFLLTTEDEKTFYFLEDKIITLMQTQYFEMPTNELSAYPMLVKGILDRSLDKLTSDIYKFPLYQLISSFNMSGYDRGYKKEVILPILLEDYLTTKQEYIKFDADYSTKFVYTAWKDSYSVTRNRMGLFIRLMEFYFSDEVERELQEALEFNDPFIKADALLVCIAKSLPYEQKPLVECAEHIESAEMIYWRLVENNLEHLYPFTGEKQPHFAKSRLFFTVFNLSDHEQVLYPEDIQIVDKIETKNAYEQPLRYYLMSFKEQNTLYVGWVGGYTLEDGEDTPNMTHDSYTDFIEFNSMSIEQHKQAFLEKDQEEKLVYQNHVFYESTPKINNFAWFLLFPLTAKWLQVLSGSGTSLLFTSIFTVIIGAFFTYEIINSKRRKVLIYNQQLIKQDGSTQHSINVQDIKKIERNKKHIHVYNQNDELAFTVPLRWVRYEIFYQHMKQHTAHLNHQPYIQS